MNLNGHFPQLVWHRKFTNPTSAVQRALLCVPAPTIGTHVLYILVFHKLQPITELDGEDLFNVWHQCILCHLNLWKGGVHHRDASPSNMTYYKSEGALMGIFYSYDLSSLSTPAGPGGNERMGTIPFMALDLLSNTWGQRSQVKHLYRHDLESFMWVFAWIFLRYRKGALWESHPLELDEWATLGAVACGKEKLYFQNHVEKYQPSDINRSHPNFSDIKLRMWALLMDCFTVLNTADHNRQRARVRLAQEKLWGGTGQLTHAEESHSDMDKFLLEFTTTAAWIKLSALSQ